MNLDDFSFVEEDRRYINPQTSLDEQNAFVQTLRDTQAQRNAQIQQDTYNLGTAVPSNLGGLVGGESYFTSRYQTPQTNTLVADLRAAAQAQALNEAMNNELSKAKERYNRAYRSASKRRAKSGGGGGSSPLDSGLPDNVTEEPTSSQKNQFWGLNFNDEVANYGLYQLKRNPGESQENWEGRVAKWHSELDAKNSWRAYPGNTEEAMKSNLDDIVKNLKKKQGNK